MNSYKVNGVEISTFKDKEEVELLQHQIEMAKVTNYEFDTDKELYVFELDNNDQITVKENEYNTMKIFESKNGLQYKPFVNENEDDDTLELEYIGFKLL